MRTSDHFEEVGHGRGRLLVPGTLGALCKADHLFKTKGSSVQTACEEVVGPPSLSRNPWNSYLSID